MTTFLTIDGKRPAAHKCLLMLLATMLILGWTGMGLSAGAGSPDVSSPVAAPAQGHDRSSAYRNLLPSSSDLVPDPAIEWGRLANGFGYLLMKNRHPENRVSLHLYVRAGSLNETDRQRGLAHFLEHMQFNGSTHFPPGELVRYFQSIGMQFGNDANAHTGFDETVYDIVLPAGDEENLQKGLLVMQDYAMGATLTEEEVRRESGVILAEMRTRDSAGYRTFKATLQFELPDFLASRRLPIGDAEVIRHADRALLKDFYDTWYRPDNMVLLMVGDFDIPLARTLIRARFEDARPRAPAAVPPDLGSIAHRGLNVFYHHEPEVGGTTVSIEVVRPYQPQPDSLSVRRRETIAELADRIVQNRLNTIQKKTDAPFTAAVVGSGTYLNHIRYAEISADTNPENWQPALTVLEHTLRRARRFGFIDSELKRVKKEMLTTLENAVKGADTRNSTQLARSMIRQLSDNRVIQSPLQEQTLYAPIIEAVTLDDVHRAFLENWPDDHHLVLLTGNADLKEHTTRKPVEQIRDAFLGAASAVVTPPRTEAAVVFPYLPPPDDTGRVAFRQDIADLGITEIQFANGVRLVLKPTDFKTNEVLANLIFGHGRSREPADHPGISLLAEATVNESGLGAMDTNDLDRALAGTSTTAHFSVREGYFNYFAQSVSGEMALLFQLFHAHLVDQGFREDAMRLARERLDQQHRSLRRSIEGMMQIEGQRFLAGGDTRFGMPDMADLQAIALNDIHGWIAPQLASAPLELSVVGDFDVNAAIELARRYLGSLADRGAAARPVREQRPYLPTGQTRRIDVDTRIDKAMVVVAWPTDDYWDIRRTRRLSVLADVFSERLRERVREKLGASYSPYAFNQASRSYDGYGTFQVHVSVAPDQVDRVRNEVEAIARDLAQNGITDDERMRALDPILTAIKEYRKTNGYWLNSVATGSGRAAQQFEWARSFMDDYGAITSRELSELAARYLVGQQSAVVIIQPGSDQR